MADTDKENIVIRSFKRVIHAMGITTQGSDVQAIASKPAQDVNLSIYSYSELERLPDFSKNKNARGNSSDQITSYLKEMATLSRQRTVETKNLKVLTPEIDQARDIFVSSIMSPNDMQTDAVGFELDIPSIGDEVSEEIREYISNYFNDKTNLGGKNVKWFNDCLFESGAHPVLVLPRVNIEHLFKYNKIASPSKGNPTVDAESSLESFIDIKSFTKEVELTSESILGDIVKTEHVAELSRNVPAGITKLLRDSKSHVIISSDAALMSARYSNMTDSMTKINKKMNDVFIGAGANKDIMLLDTSEDIGDHDHPVVVEVPSYSVVPIGVPGNTSEHIGYFVLVDEWGTPLNPLDINNSPNGTVSGRLATSNVNSIFGGGTNVAKQMSEHQKLHYITNVFSVAVKSAMTKMLENNDIKGVTVEKHEAISNFIFHKLLAGSDNPSDVTKIKLIFVPSTVLVYYAFDFRDDGTGKSLIEDLSLVLALRNTLFIAGVMAAVKNAVDQKVVEIQVDEKNVNLEQTLDMVRNLYTEKHMYRFDNNPMAIARDIVQKSLTVIPRGIKGLSDSLNVTTDHKSAGVVAPDDSLIDRLTNMIVLKTGVPPSALNQLSDTEYSRSVATNNLFFSNKIRNCQKIANMHNTKYVRLILRYSKPLQKGICEILERYNTKETKPNETVVALDITKSLNAVISNIETTLPSPSISTDKSHYEELRAFSDLVDATIDKIYSDDLLPGKSADMKEQLATFRALVKSDLIRNFLDTVGFQGSFDVPFADDIDTDVVENLSQQLLNFKKKIDKHIKVLSGEKDVEDSSGAGW